MAVTDLTGTKWLLNDTIDYGQNDLRFSNLDFDFNYITENDATSYSTIEHANNFDIYVSTDFEDSSFAFGVFRSLRDQFPINRIEEDYNIWRSRLGGGMANIFTTTDQATLLAMRTVKFNGGTDATNPDLIAWLEANAEQIIEPTGNEYTLTQNLTNLTSGNITLTITADEGYALPAQADIVVTGGTIVSYDNTTGVLVVTAGTTAVEFECESAVSTISFSIDGTTYQADDGMGWDLWVISPYNTGGITFQAGAIRYGGSLVGYNNEPVDPAEVIIENRQYVLLNDE